LKLFECYKNIIPEFDIFLKALDTPHPSHLRINTLKVDEEKLIIALQRYGCKLSQLPINYCYSFLGLDRPSDTIEYLLGYYHMQGLSSAVVSVILAPKKGEKVLDMCASPGSKTTHIAAIMENKGIIIANEMNHNRVGILRFHLERMGITNVIVTTYQAQNFPMKYFDKKPIKFDKVLLDAPCSCEGRYRKVLKKGEKMYNFSENVSLRLSRYQKQMILRGFDLLKYEGILVYSTCTYSPDENEAVIDYLIHKRKGVKIEPIKITGIKTVNGIIKWKGKRFTEDLRKAVRLYPHYVDSWGFFITKIKKVLT